MSKTEVKLSYLFNWLSKENFQIFISKETHTLGCYCSPFHMVLSPSYRNTHIHTLPPKHRQRQAHICTFTLYICTYHNWKQNQIHDTEG